MVNNDHPQKGQELCQKNIGVEKFYIGETTCKDLVELKKADNCIQDQESGKVAQN